MPFERYHVSLKAIIRRDDGCVLGLNGKPGGSLEGYYDLPGGRIEVEELTRPFEAIIRREVREELGADLEFSLSLTPVAVGRHVSKDGIPVLYVFYEALVDNPDVALEISTEHVGVAWLDLSAQPLEKLFISGLLDGMKQWYTARHET